MNKKVHHIAARMGLLLHGNKIWISEITSVFFIAFILLLLVASTFLLFVKEYKIHKNEKKISVLKANEWTAQKTLDQLVAKERISAAIKSELGINIAEPAYYQLVNLVYENSKTFGYDPLLVLAVIRVESVFNPQAKGRYKNSDLSGALGLMQIKPETAMEIAAFLKIPVKTNADLMRPEINMAIGVAYLTKLISSFKSFKLGLLAYNQGPSAIKEYLNGNQQLSIDYYNKVLRRYYILKKHVDKR
jgi:soluble lytic murein transglycosylase-like protein